MLDIPIEIESVFSMSQQSEKVVPSLPATEPE
jgi:hypothetical protein